MGRGREGEGGGGEEGEGGEEERATYKIGEKERGF